MPVTLRSKVAGEVKGFDAANYMDLKMAQRTRRGVHFAVPAANEAIAQAELNLEKEPLERVGIISSNMMEHRFIAEGWSLPSRGGKRRADPLFFTKGLTQRGFAATGAAAGGIKGPNTSVNSLCASGTDTIGTAMNFIRLGYADVMLAAASDASLDTMTVSALNVLGALTREPDPAKACRPFDANRSGFVYGEGCGVLVLESLEHALKRGANILAEIGGVGWGFDAFDATAPQSETEAMTMKSAIREAGITPDEVDFVNAHGTSTRLNDVSETRALKIVFGERAYKVPISANKSMFGHMITAGGAVEVIGAILSMNNSMLPPTIHYETPDPDCDLDYVPNQARPAELNVCLKDSFGLGGQNCCMILKNTRRASS